MDAVWLVICVSIFFMCLVTFSKEMPDEVAFILITTVIVIIFAGITYFIKEVPYY